MGKAQGRSRAAEHQKAEQRHHGSKATPGKKPHPIEWLLGALSAALVLAMIGFTLYRAISATTETPDLDVVVERIEAASGRFRVGFRVDNRGDATAATVKIEGQLKRGDETIETSETTLDYVPAHSTRRGGLLFNHDPSRFVVRLEARSYQEP